MSCVEDDAFESVNEVDEDEVDAQVLVIDDTMITILKKVFRKYFQNF